MKKPALGIPARTGWPGGKLRIYIKSLRERSRYLLKTNRKSMMKRFRKWAEREHSARERIIALFFECLFFTVIIPLLFAAAASYLNRWLPLPRLAFWPVNPILGTLLIVSGGLLALWSVQIQFTLGRGTPAPVMPTRKLIKQGPYSYCRNPMTLGTSVFYLGVGVLLGSLWIIGFSLAFLVLLITYVKAIEEKELESRFGEEYREYKRLTPFLIPRPRRGKQG